MITFRNREIANERLVLESRTELFYLGPALTLRNCTLVVKVPKKALVLNQVHMIDCTIEVARVLKNCRWDAVHLKGCQFKGRFIGNDFGEWPSSPSQGSIVGCDFTAAHLDQTRFLSCDADTLGFPQWPCFTLYDTASRAAELGALPWPGKKGYIIAEGFAEDPPSTVAVTYAAPELAKFCGTTPEAIKALIEELDGVYY
ncbi:MAG: hypothetical protein ACJ8AT_31580 [Hyalangium sp.]|uniref:hypothetical protein n=1 Tax=Hyalangium sp. TaxID=2028555 RepID=UPI003899AEB2